MSEQESSNRARKIPGKFCKFCEPLEKVRARFSEKKILPKSGLLRTHNGAQGRAQEILFDVLTCDFHGLTAVTITTHVYMGQHRELLEDLDIACSRNQFKH